MRVSGRQLTRPEAACQLRTCRETAAEVTHRRNCDPRCLSHMQPREGREVEVGERRGAWCAVACESRHEGPWIALCTQWLRNILNVEIGVYT
jgi:hypothetical protein